jgi:hypothetical protein
MLNRIMDFTGDLFPLIMTLIYGLCAFAWGMYYTRDLRKPGEAKRERAQKERTRLVHKPS